MRLTVSAAIGGGVGRQVLAQAVAAHLVLRVLGRSETIGRAVGVGYWGWQTPETKTGQAGRSWTLDSANREPENVAMLAPKDRKEGWMTEQMYGSLAGWWQAISPPSEYTEEAELYADMIRRAAHGSGLGPVREVLELGSGGGNNASHMKRHFAMTLVEPAGGMRELSRALNPECEHLPGDMRTVRLGRTFDAVFVHDAVMYMTTEEDLRAALATVAAHLAPGGVALVAPDATAETFEEATEHGGGDDEHGRSARYLSWTLPPAPGGTVFETHYAFLLREPDGTVRSAHDVHREGLFTRAAWLGLFDGVGLAAQLTPREIEGGEYDSFVAVHSAP